MRHTAFQPFADIALDRCDVPSLAMRPTVVGGELLANDYSIYSGSQLVGRIRDLRDYGWEWALALSTPELSSASGTEKTFERAKNALVANWISLHSALRSPNVSDDRKASRH